MLIRSKKGLTKERIGNFIDNKLHGDGKVIIEKNSGKKIWLRRIL